MPNPVPEDLESDWTPRFPGLSDAESCGEWDTGIPIVHKSGTVTKIIGTSIGGVLKGSFPEGRPGNVGEPLGFAYRNKNKQGGCDQGTRHDN